MRHPCDEDPSLLPRLFFSLVFFSERREMLLVPNEGHVTMCACVMSILLFDSTSTDPWPVHAFTINCIEVTGGDGNDIR